MVRRTAVVGALAALVLGFAPASASADRVAEAPSCGTDWGLHDKSAAPTVTGSNVVNVRSGRQDCFDRLVIDVNGPVDGYTVHYKDQIFEDPTAVPISLRGDAALSVNVNAQNYDSDNQLTYRPADKAEIVDVTGYRTFRQVAWAGSHHGTASVGIGLRDRLPFRVSVLPGKIVVDVAHQ